MTSPECELPLRLQERFRTWSGRPPLLPQTCQVDRCTWAPRITAFLVARKLEGVITNQPVWTWMSIRCINHPRNGCPIPKNDQLRGCCQHRSWRNSSTRNSSYHGIMATNLPTNHPTHQPTYPPTSTNLPTYLPSYHATYGLFMALATWNVPNSKPWYSFTAVYQDAGALRTYQGMLGCTSPT